MSVQNVERFFNKVDSDKALQERIRTIQATSDAQAIAEVVKLATDAGFPFSAEHYSAALKEEIARYHSAGELSEEALAQVAGGGLVTYSPNVGGGISWNCGSVVKYTLTDCAYNMTAFCG
jgi:predicted ribosomally synthesized peptide with nif11-like leader